MLAGVGVLFPHRARIMDGKYACAPRGPFFREGTFCFFSLEISGSVSSAPGELNEHRADGVNGLYCGR